MEDESILNKSSQENQAYLDDLAMAVCINGDRLEKYEKLVVKQCGSEVFANMKVFVEELQRSVERKRFTNTSKVNLNYLGKNAGLSQATVNRIVVYHEALIDEDEYWDKCLGSKAGCQSYLKRYPNGKYATSAQTAIAAFEEQERKEKEEKQEQSFWRSCQTEDASGFQKYLNRYPNGKYAFLARSIIADMQRKQKEERDRKAREKQEEEEYWNRFSESKSGCQFYLNRYPYGKYASMAHSAIDDYEKKEKEGEQKEQFVWNSCRTKADFQQYLNQYPQGMYASQAYVKMLEAEKEENNRNQHLLRIENGAVSCKDDSIEGSLVIPFKINGQHVTAIGEDAFAYCGNLTSVIIPDGVTKIGRSAFYFCRSLASIVIPDSVTEIGYFALRCCDNLRRIVIKDASLLEKAFAPREAQIEKP